MIADDRPKIKDLYAIGVVKQLSAACAMRSTIWKQLGYQLSLNQANLNIIEANYLHDIERCRSGMLNLWLEKQPDASWEILRKASVDVELEQLASIINQRLSSENSSSLSKKYIGHLNLIISFSLVPPVLKSLMWINFLKFCMLSSGIIGTQSVSL